MSEHSHPAVSLPPAEHFDTRISGRALFICGAIGIISLAIIALAAIFGMNNPALLRQIAFSWMFGFYFFFSICAGSVFWILVHHASDAAWSVVVRRQMENLAALFPWLALFFLPLILFRENLWSWMNISPGANPVFDQKLWYFAPKIGGVTVPFFWIRAAFYFFFFISTALFFRRQSAAQDGNGNPQHSFNMRAKSCSGLVLFGICLTFAGFDWLMGLDYHWVSTIWGVYLFAGAIMAAMAVLVLVITALKGSGYLSVVGVEHYHTMGKLLLVFSTFWSYMAYAQYMLIWYANIPEETGYFLLRNTESWNTLNILLVIGHFFVPFLLLLPRFVKRIPRLLAGIAAWLLFMHLLDVYIIVLPNIHRGGWEPSPLDFLCPLGMGCLLTVVFLLSLAKTSLFPNRDPRLIESLKLTN